MADGYFFVATGTIISDTEPNYVLIVSVSHCPCSYTSVIQHSVSSRCNTI